jgi:hypothetical protein
MNRFKALRNKDVCQSPVYAIRCKHGVHLAGFTAIDPAFLLCYAVQWDLASSDMQVSSL